MGDITKNFSRSEFACHHCGVVKFDQRLVLKLQTHRDRIKKPIRIVSGYRCLPYIKQLGGVLGSQHQWGRAADLEPGVMTIDQARALGFTGIGHRSGWAVHVDVRPGSLQVFPD